WLHLHVHGEEIDARVDTVLDGMLEKVASGEALAHESGIPVGKDREDRIDLAFADQRFERTAIQSAGHEADSSASSQRVSSCTPCRDRRVARSWRGRCTTSPTRRSRRSFRPPSSPSTTPRRSSATPTAAATSGGGWSAPSPLSWSRPPP